MGWPLCFCLETLDSSFKTAEEVEHFLGGTVLGTIPEIARRPNVKSVQDGIVLLSEPGGVAAESFRSLRASLGLLARPR